MDEVLKKIRAIGLLLIHYYKKEQMTAMFYQSWKNVFKSEPELDECIQNEIEVYKLNIADLEKQGEKLLKKLPLWTEWLRYVNGVGVSLTLRILGIIDFDKAPTISSVWKHFGLAPNTTQYSRTAKGLIYKQVLSFLGLLPYGLTPAFISNPKPRRNGGYARYFMREYERVNQKHPEWNNKRKILHSMRLTGKLFLSNLFVVYHWLKGCKGDILLHYASKHLNHNWIYMPVIDKEDKPDWWLELKKEYEKMGLKPVVI